MDLSERSAGRPASDGSRHPWEIARAAFLLDVLQYAGGLQTPAGVPPRVLDVGSGDGYVARTLLGRATARVCCWDLHFTDDDLAALSRVDGVTPSRAAPEGTFDAALLLDVIEHVEDDVALLADVAARVRPGGLVLVSVPAWSALFSAHDVALRHHRRYTPASCRDVVARAGMQVVSSGGFFHGLLAPRAAAVAVEKVVGRKPARAGVGGWRAGEVVTAAIVSALRAEQRISTFFARRGVDVPGLSFFALCRVPHGAHPVAR